MGFWASLGIAVTSGIGAYFASYLREKGKNLATREDIATLTKVVDDIKTENALLVERFKSQQQLRYAAIDKRLDIHQQAFTLWRELVGKVYAEDIRQFVDKCDRWWEEHCLYLEPAAREAFFLAYIAARDYRSLVETRTTLHAQDAAELVNSSFNRIMKAGDVIARAVALPGLTDAEKKAAAQEMGMAG